MSLVKEVGLKEIAYELGVSINTVSRALRDCDDISEGMKKKVRTKAIELGYSPNGVEDYVKKNLKKSIAFVGPDFTNSYFTIMCNELIHYLDDSKYNFNLIILNKNTLEEEDIKRCILQRVDGIISFLEVNQEIADIAKLYNIPLVAVGRQTEVKNIDNIFTDDYEGGRLAGEYLFGEKLCKNPCFLTYKDCECRVRRQDGFVSVANKYGVNVDIVEINDKTELKVEEFYDKYDSIFCFNDELAYLLLYNVAIISEEANEKFKDVHIVGYDALAHRIRGLKRITSINSNYHAIAEFTMNLIQRRVENRNKPITNFERKMFDVSLYRRLGNRKNS
jgi:LacI family transcriptional regulator